MLPGATLPLPASLASLLAVFGAVVHRPVVPYVHHAGLRVLAQTGRRSVCGMLAGAGLSRAWSHDRAHFVFTRAPLERR
jgi:hypothetical protein